MVGWVDKRRRRRKECEDDAAAAAAAAVPFTRAVDVKDVEDDAGGCVFDE